MLDFRTRMSENGRILLPAECRKAMNLEPEEEIIIRVAGEEATIFSAKHAVKQAQALVRARKKGKGSLVKQLLDMRKEEAPNG